MSILIEGMEMPRTCYDCKFRKRNGLELICPVLGKSYKIADTQVLFVREKDCPLTEVPEPHGRLIDADAPISLVDTHGEKVEVTVAHIIEKNRGIVKAVIPASMETELW